MTARKADVLTTHGSHPRSRPVRIPADEDVLNIQASTPRSLNGSSPLTQPGHAKTTCGADGPDSPRSPNYSLSKLYSRPTSDTRAVSHIGVCKSANRPGCSSFPGAQEHRQDSHQHDKLSKPKPLTPTPDSVRELTFDGYVVDSPLHDLESVGRCDEGVQPGSNPTSHSTDDSGSVGGESDILVSRDSSSDGLFES
jgi:hypothetical protein